MMPITRGDCYFKYIIGRLPQYFEKCTGDASSLSLMEFGRSKWD